MVRLYFACWYGICDSLSRHHRPRTRHLVHTHRLTPTLARLGPEAPVRSASHGFVAESPPASLPSPPCSGLSQLRFMESSLQPTASRWSPAPTTSAASSARRSLESSRPILVRSNPAFT